MNYSKGFTLIELIISISIFAFMTVFLLAKYGKFNQEVLLTNLAYDIALTVRNAQSYGLNVKSVNGDDDFENSYGVHFTTGSTFIFFRDLDGNNKYTDSAEDIGSPYVIRRTNLSITSVCATDAANRCRGTSTDPASVVDILFKRPDPNAIIILKNSVYGDNTARSQAQIKIQSSSDTNLQKIILVRSTGQIAITN